MNLIAVKHNIEVAHRLSLLPGKCQNIHGHSMQVELELSGGELDERGIYEGIDFGSFKKTFREHLDAEYDHRLLLNKDDPWVQDLLPLGGDSSIAGKTQLPGQRLCPGDPTTENIALWIAEWAENDAGPYNVVRVIVWETATNMAAVVL